MDGSTPWYLTTVDGVTIVKGPKIFVFQESDFELQMG